MVKKKWLSREEFIEKLKKEGKYDPENYRKKKEETNLNNADIPDCCRKCEDKLFNKDGLFCGNTKCKKPEEEYQRLKDLSKNID